MTSPVVFVGSAKTSCGHKLGRRRLSVPVGGAAVNHKEDVNGQCFEIIRSKKMIAHYRLV